MGLEGTALKRRNSRELLTTLCVRIEDAVLMQQPHSCGLIPVGLLQESPRLYLAKEKANSFLFQ